MFIYLSLARNFARKKRATDATQQTQLERALSVLVLDTARFVTRKTLTFLLRQA